MTISRLYQYYIKTPPPTACSYNKDPPPLQLRKCRAGHMGCGRSTWRMGDLGISSHLVQGFRWVFATQERKTLQNTATHCNTLQHTATHCNTLQQKRNESKEIQVLVWPRHCCCVRNVGRALWVRNGTCIVGAYRDSVQLFTRKLHDTCDICHTFHTFHTCHAASDVAEKYQNERAIVNMSDRCPNRTTSASVGMRTHANASYYDASHLTICIPLWGDYD